MIPMTTNNARIGHGDPTLALSMYEGAILNEKRVMEREGVFFCLANLAARMKDYNQEILNNVFWSMARSGAF
jgi:hypothetical protein